MISLATALLASTLVQSGMQVAQGRSLAESIGRQTQELAATTNQQIENMKFQSAVSSEKLRIQHRMTEGKDTVALAASGTNMSGSSLDVYMQNVNMRTADEAYTDMSAQQQQEEVRRRAYAGINQLYNKQKENSSAILTSILGNGINSYVAYNKQQNLQQLSTQTMNNAKKTQDLKNILDYGVIRSQDPYANNTTTQIRI